MTQSRARRRHSRFGRRAVGARLVCGRKKKLEGGAFAGTFGRKKRIKDARQHRRRDSPAIVPNFDARVAAGLQVGMWFGLASLNRAALQGEHDMAESAAQGVRGIRAEVEENLVQLRGIHLGVGNPLIQIHSNLNACRNGRAEQLDYFPDHG